MTKRIEQDTGWMTDAACVGVDPELFYHGEHTAETVEAKSVCSGCPVQGECLEFDLASDQQWGTWGGIGEEERRRIKRKQDSVQRNIGRTTLRSAS